jgi:CheY-like chemotaxis protein
MPEPGCLAIPVVVVTGKDLTADDRARLNGGVSRILQKGSDDRTDLMDEIRRLIGARLQTGRES